jgi:hypothetical protein
MLVPLSPTLRVGLSLCHVRLITRHAQCVAPPLSGGPQLQILCPTVYGGNSHVQPSLGVLLGNRVHEPQGSVDGGAAACPARRLPRPAVVLGPLRRVLSPTSPAPLGAHPPMPPATSTVSPVAVFPSPIRRGVSPGNASAPRIDYTSNHGMAHTESGVFLTSWEHGLATFDRRVGPALGRSALSARRSGRAGCDPPVPLLPETMSGSPLPPRPAALGFHPAFGSSPLCPPWWTTDTPPSLHVCASQEAQAV